MKIRVYYEDTDMGGVVYHTNYLKFCERARSEVFFQKGLLPHNDEGHFFVKELYANYISSAKLGDLLDIKTSLFDMKAASFKVYQEIFLDEKKVFETNITLVHVDKNSKIKKFTREQKILLEELFK